MIFYSTDRQTDRQSVGLPFSQVVTNGSLAEQLCLEQPASYLISTVTKNRLALEEPDPLDEGGGKEDMIRERKKLKEEKKRWWRRRRRRRRKSRRIAYIFWISIEFVSAIANNSLLLFRQFDLPTGRQGGRDLERCNTSTHPQKQIILYIYNYFPLTHR